ncbi:MAG: hypothetical protein AAFX58_01650 [Pseudomonadota bacterium]
MALIIDRHEGLKQDRADQFALDCPYCDVHAHLTPEAVPAFEALASQQPRHVGMVYQCSACAAPIFLRFAVKRYGEDKIELYQNFVELERRREKFSLSYLPQATETYFREALACYSDGHLNAFASMCRRTAQSVFDAMGEGGKVAAFNEVSTARRLADIDERSFQPVRAVLFDGPDENTLPKLTRADAGILLELTKDLLYQTFVRRAKLSRALKVRRFFVAENADQANAG